MSSEPEALRLADQIAEWQRKRGVVGAMEHDMLLARARVELQRLTAERDADRAVMREALFHLEHASGESNGIDENESGNLRALVTSLNAAIEKLKARTG